ncbi:hypothetical protein LTR50_002580 [Elasticomyces elasticus]|nr:hypothetical protein LTR50_002580 [Elasticomyces elasticus]
MAAKGKKKKPAANPARGFATTSITSKPKAVVNSNVTPSEISSISTAPTSVTSEDVVSRGDISDRARELHELSPEELEAQLEISELQNLVEKHATKARKASSRQVTRLQTEQRLLRSQAETLSVRDWLPDELVSMVIDLALEEPQINRPLLQTASKRKAVNEDIMLSRLWQLQLTLLDLSIPSSLVQDVVEHMCHFPPPDEMSSQVWGLIEGLDWIALHGQSSGLRPYDEPAIKPSTGSAHASASAYFLTVKDTPQMTPSTSGYATPEVAPPISLSEIDKPLVQLALEDPGDDTDVSDLASDLEEDELLSVYISTKIRLFERDPDLLLVTGVRKQKSKSRVTKSETAPTKPSSGSSKLLKKLYAIESDILFDQREADARWIEKHTALVQEQAQRKRLRLHPGDTKHVASSHSKAAETESTGDAVSVLDDAARTADALLKEFEDSDDDLIGGIFDTIPQPITSTKSTDDAPPNVVLRDFGKSVGMNPRRVLEEACRARDPDAILQYALVSPTTFAARQRLCISWVRYQEAVDSSLLPEVLVQTYPKALVLTMTGIATPDQAQSESYIATVALFLVFSSSPREEKAYLKLPPAYRDLWAELVALKQDKVDATDRENVRELRQLIRLQETRDDDEADDEHVLRNAIMRRNKGISGTSTPNSVGGDGEQPSHNVSQGLKDLWARKASTASFQRMLLARMNLPMFQFRSTALSAIEENQVVIICGETGCGKSTQLPAYILENELSHGRSCKIYCTEPRRISAISLAQRVSEELGEAKGDVGTARSLVGYAIRLESHTTAQTRLVYATVGIVLRLLESTKGLNDITHLVIDEIHERSIDTDFLLVILQSLMLQRSDLRIVLMSATVDAQRFSRYLNNAPIVTVPGRTFPVQAKFLEDAIEITGYSNDNALKQSHGRVIDDDEDDEFMKTGTTSAQRLQNYSTRTLSTLKGYDEYQIDYNLILMLLETIAYAPQYNRFSSAVLVFLPGIAEIRQLNNMIASYPAFSQGWLVYPLHSSFSTDAQQAAFQIPPSGMRKIVLSTNIAETGVTIPDVTCVIDTGKHKEMRFDERRQMSRLGQSFISQANAKQRRGRAGRVQEGICFHLFTKYRYDELMAPSQTPEILRLSLQDLVIRVKICKLGDIEHTLSSALDAPSSKNIRRAIDALIEVNAMTPREELTPLGIQLSKLPLDAHLGKLVLLGCVFGCLDFALTAAALLSSKSPFLAPIDAKKQADTVRSGFKKGDSDLQTAYNAYCAWRKICASRDMSELQFCRKNFLSPENLASAEDLRGQFLTVLESSGFIRLTAEERSSLGRSGWSRKRTFALVPAALNQNNDNETILNSVAAWAFYPKVLVRDGKGWRSVANNQSVSLHPTSINKPGVNAKYLSFYSIMQSSSRFTNAQETSPVSDFALVLLAGDAVFHMYAGVIVVDGNRLRFKVADWRTMIALKILRTRLKDILEKKYKSPGRELSARDADWMEVFGKIFDKESRKAR